MTPSLWHYGAKHTSWACFQLTLAPRLQYFGIRVLYIYLFSHFCLFKANLDHICISQSASLILKNIRTSSSPFLACSWIKLLIISLIRLTLTHVIGLIGMCNKSLKVTLCSLSTHGMNHVIVFYYYFFSFSSKESIC